MGRRTDDSGIVIDLLEAILEVLQEIRERLGKKE